MFLLISDVFLLEPVRTAWPGSIYYEKDTFIARCFLNPMTNRTNKQLIQSVLFGKMTSFFHFSSKVMLWFLPTSSQWLRTMQKKENCYYLENSLFMWLYIYMYWIKKNFTTDPINQQRCSLLRMTMSYIPLFEQSKVHGTDNL